MALTTLRARTTALLAAAALSTAGAAVAQQATQSTQGDANAQAQVQIEPVTEAEINKFVAANNQVSTIATEANAELQAAEDKAAAQEIQASAQEKMIAAIQEEGLTAQRFTEIVQLAQADEELANKLRAKMEG
ncbi:DUF4168 domain-containing protein [Henriciella aquimarina]|uniref:DUF4168 domain-containing protein n=1 Tax=Henriciella aquimarina TaxID=545261 RepID=UPI0009FD952D|nr:DUF4168 domain-containing protein [Henriciella aquimarina]